MRFYCENRFLLTNFLLYGTSKYGSKIIKIKKKIDVFSLW